MPLADAQPDVRRPDPPAPLLRRALWLAAPFLALALLSKLPSLGFAHREPDEAIYWAVAKQLGDYGTYTLRGAPFLEKLPRRMYDRPLFHHPPLYPALLAPFAQRDLRREAVVLSWLGHALAIVAVALIGARLHARLGGGGGAWSALALPLLGIALDPVFVHAGRKLWIDALVGGLAALAVALALAAGGARRRRAWLLAAGVALGLAGLAKLPGLLVAPVCAAAALAGPGSFRERAADVACVALPSFLLVAPWFALFYATYGTLLPHWAAPDAQLVARFPLVAAAVERPPTFFAAQLAAVQPLLLVALAALAWRPPAGERRPREAWILLGWLAGVGACLTLLGATGFGFQTRFLTPLCAAVYALPLALPAWYRAPSARPLRAAAALALAWAAAGAAPYLVNGRPDEIVGLAERLGLLRS